MTILQLIINVSTSVSFRITDLPDGLCPVAPSERKECGYYGITKEECLAKSCCWDPTVPNTKWCFKQPGEYRRKKGFPLDVDKCRFYSYTRKQITIKIISGSFPGVYCVWIYGKDVKEILPWCMLFLLTISKEDEIKIQRNVGFSFAPRALSSFSCSNLISFC